MEFSEPWYLTVVSTQGVQFVRSSDRSWRPIVDVTVVDHERTHETILGCDGRNPNLKAPIELYDVSHTSRLDIKVWHQSRTKKSNRKRHLVGSVFLTLADIVRKQDRPASNITLSLKCPPMRKRSPTVSGGRQLNCAMLVVRLTPPSSSSSPSSSSTPSILSRQSTLIHSNLTSDYEDPEYSHDKTLVDSSASSTTSLQKSTLETNDNTLRRRRKRKSQKHKAYHIDTTDAELSDASSSETSTDCPPTPPVCEPNSRHHSLHHENEFNDGILDDVLNMTFASSCDNDCDSSEVDVCMSRSAVLPPPQPMSRVELILDSFSPYRQLSHPRCDFGAVLRGLLSEWYSVGACLLATATLNAAVFGYSSGTLFDMDSLALRSVTIGSIASGLGLVIDAWFLVLYGSGDVDRFRRLATDISSLPSSSSANEYPTYFYFSLICRLPAMCLFIAACALMLFLLAVAWMAWPTAVLVMCFGMGVVLTLQYLVFGAKRVGGGVLWVVRKVRSGFGFGRRKRAGGKRISVAPFDAGSGSGGGGGTQSPAGMERSDSLPPPPYSSPMMVLTDIPADVQEAGEGEGEGEGSPSVELGPSISRRPDSDS